MNQREFDKIIFIVSEKLKFIFENSIFHYIQFDKITHSENLTDEHIIRTQGMVINDLCTKIDQLKDNLRQSDTERKRLSNKLGYLKSSSMEVKNAS